ncbi:Transcription initiation factor IIB [Candidatus Burarchaeum australiense]|nr:Transcription initiation factor IIB [Candidatus Burarchaeum australiense]
MTETCPECKSKNLVRDHEKGEVICKECGLIVSEELDAGPEWRAFDSEQRDKRARTGAPSKYMRPNKGLVTEIDQYNRDIRGVKISSNKQAQLYRMRKWHKRASVASSMERNLSIALSELDRIASYLGLPEGMREAAALLYRRCVERGLIRGRLIEAVVAGVLYAICREYGVPRTLDELAAQSNIEKKEIGRAYRLIAREMNLKLPLTDPSQYIPRLCSSLKLSGRVQERAIEMTHKAINGSLISGRGPSGVAAAAVYIAASLEGERRTQKEVSDVAGVTEVTIRNRYRELKKALNLKA